jgi:ABC-type antimicrobial peptide transport system permease subunit
VFGSILRQGAWLALLGLGVGLAVSFAFMRCLRGLLFEVVAIDVDLGTLAAAAAALFLVALSACYFPARRAASTDPMRAPAAASDDNAPGSPPTLNTRLRAHVSD